MMCRITVLAATTSLLAMSALAAPQPAPAQPPATAPAPAAAAATTPAKGPAKAPVKASAADRAAASRLDPLQQVTFWSAELQADPRDAEAYMALARNLRTLGRYEQALDAAKSALIFNPTSQEAMLEEARTYIAAGQGFYAILPAQAAAELAPKDWRPVGLLAVAYEQSERTKEALDAYQKAIALAPDQAAPTSNFGMFLAGHEQMADGEKLLRKAVTMKNAGVQERQNLAFVLGLQGKLDEAENLMRRDLPPDVVASNMALLRASAPQPTTTAEAAPKPAAARTYEALKAGG